MNLEYVLSALSGRSNDIAQISTETDAIDLCSLNPTYINILFYIALFIYLMKFQLVTQGRPRWFADAPKSVATNLACCSTFDA